MRRRLGSLVLAGCVAVCTALALAPVAAAGAIAPAAHQWHAPQQYYLSLGDSLGYGYQDIKVPTATSPASFNTGYTDDLAKLMRWVKPGIAVVNYSCPEESSRTMINGGCPGTNYPPVLVPATVLHNFYTGPQLAAAVAFLQGHPAAVPLITLSIGANDVLADTKSCLGATSCPALAGDLATLHSNLTRILTELHSAAPTAKIIVLTPYNPFAVAYPESNLLAVQLNLTIGETTLANHARIADAFIPFNVLKRPGLCLLTYFCGNGDIHPTDRGYQTIANSFFLSYLF